MRHQIAPYLKSPVHPITVNLIGCGGTGSQILNKLGQIHLALVARGHLGLYVRVWDGDLFSPANVGRQACFKCDVGYNKAQICVDRINQAFGLIWEAVPFHYDINTINEREMVCANITISAVDSYEARKSISELLSFSVTTNLRVDERKRPYYWIDSGNAKNVGQVVLGTVQEIRQPKAGLLPFIPDVLMVHPEMRQLDVKEVQGDSCSLADALNQQHLAINGMMAMWVQEMVYGLFDNHRINSHGVYVNLDTKTTVPLLLKHTAEIDPVKFREERVSEFNAYAKKGIV